MAEPIVGQPPFHDPPKQVAESRIWATALDAIAVSSRVQNTRFII